MEQPIKKNKLNFLPLPDLAFGFVHKRSGNEIRERSYKSVKVNTAMSKVIMGNDGFALH